MKKKTTTRKPARKRPAHLPAPRGRRGAGAVDTQPGLRTLLAEGMNRTPPPSIADQQREAAAQGFHIGKTAVCNFRKKYEAEIARVREVIAYAEELAKGGREGILHLETANRQMALATLLEEQSRMLREGEVGDKLFKIMAMIARLTTAGVAAEGLKLRHGKAVEKAFERLKAGIQQLGQQRPELRRALVAAAEEATRNLLAEVQR